MSTVPPDLNWVDARAACTAATVFNQLCDRIKDDVNEFNSVSKLSEFEQFQAAMHPRGTTITIGQPNNVPRKKIFIGIVGKNIQVLQEWDGQKWEASVGLNDEGRCILRVGSEQLEQWQFRKRALEGLLFGD